jgi:hypothetical protein
MCEEQERLSKNFTLFSNFIFDELKGTADYRIAVTSTDIGSVKQMTTNPNGKGAFMYSPAPSTRPVCTNDNTPVLPNTGDCPAEGPSGNIISAADIDAKSLEQLIEDLGEQPNDCNGDRGCQERFYRKTYLEKLFRCSATLGTNGYFIEKGLEAMRIALSCDGPNASQFGSCCQRDANNNLFYNPVCEPSAEDIANGLPAFLRPDAKLIVIFISDENDCSTPNDNPTLTGRLVCRPGGTQDDNGNSIPDIYENQYRGAASDFYQRDCGSYNIDDCKKDRCDITYAQNVECEWLRSAMTDINEYKDFLQRLKAKPDNQIIVATVVGFRGYTEKGNVMVYNKAQDYADPLCVPNPDPKIKNPLNKTETCCPGGKCEKIDINLACEIKEKDVSAGSGTRYLELSEALGTNGLGCNQYEEPDLDPNNFTYKRKSFCLQPKPNCLNGGNCSNDISVVLKCKDTNECSLPSAADLPLAANEWTLNTMYGKCPARVELLNRDLPSDLYAEITYIDETNAPVTYTSQSCVNICVDDFVEPLKIIKNKVAQLLSTYCLDRLPSCRVNENGAERACRPEEEADPNNYAQSIIVSRQCLNDKCDVQEPLRVLAYRNEWNLSINTEGACVATIQLVGIPPAGSELSIEFLSQVGLDSDGESLPNNQSAGTPAGTPAGANAGTPAGANAGTPAGASAGTPAGN